MTTRRAPGRLGDAEAPDATSPWQPVAMGSILLVVAVMLAATARGADYLIPALVAPMVIVLAIPVLQRVTAAEASPDVAWILLVGLSLRVAASVPRWQAGVDAKVYVRVGRSLAESFRQLDFSVDTGRDVPGTGSIRYLTGLVEAVLFDNAELTAVVFTLFGFAGCVLIYRAGVIALPEVDHRRVAMAIALWPTLVYWPSSIGKESVVLLGIGLVAVGAAKRLDSGGGTLLILSGAAVTGMVRPHITLLLFGSLLIAYVLATDTSGRRRSAIGKAITVVLLVGGLAITSGETLKLVEKTEEDEETTDTAGFVEERTRQGGSAFAPATVHSPADYPYAVITVLFRPFPWEAGNASAMVTALEGVALIGISAARFRHVLRLPRSFRVRPMIGFSLIYIGAFCYAFSPFGNFGLLARQRAQAIPFLLLLIAVPALGAEVQDRRRAVRRASVGWELGDADEDQGQDDDAAAPRPSVGPPQRQGRWRSNAVLRPGEDPPSPST